MKKLIFSVAAGAALTLAVGVQQGQAFPSIATQVNNACAPATPFTGDCDLCHANPTNKAAAKAGNYTFFCPPAQTPTCTDADNDGFFAEANCGTAVDCNDKNKQVYPGAVEKCTDGIDNDCDQLIDLGDPDAVNCPVACTDMDKDGYSPDGGSCGPVDCNDNDASVNPGAVDVCGDGIDQDCSGLDLECPTNIPPTPVDVPPTSDSHPLNFDNPRKDHRDYVEENGVSECLFCHSIDRADRNENMSCYKCHDKKWDDPSTKSDEEIKDEERADKDEEKYHSSKEEKDDKKKDDKKKDDKKKDD